MNPRRILLSTEDRRVIDDSRMSVERPFVRDWNLLIRHVSVNDNGEYTCQINTDPIQIKRVRLSVHGKCFIMLSAAILNGVLRDILDKKTTLYLLADSLHVMSSLFPLK